MVEPLRVSGRPMRSFGPAAVTLMVALVLLIGFTLGTLTYLELKTSKSANEACLIQARGLGAQVYLRNSLDDLSQLAALPTTPKPTPTVRWLRMNLATNLEAYVSIERHQPKTRRC